METLPSRPKHTVFKRDSEAGGTNDARACLYLVLSRQSCLDIHMLSRFLHGVWNYVRSSDSNHYVLNVLHWSHHHCMNFHTVVTKLRGSCLGMLWLQDKSWHRSFQLIPSAGLCQDFLKRCVSSPLPNWWAGLQVLVPQVCLNIQTVDSDFTIAGYLKTSKCVEILWH